MKRNTLFPYIIETHLVDHCNLDCAGCSHFAPLVDGEVYTDPDQFKRDLARLAQIFEDVYEIRLMGGEPLLHPDIISFIEFSRRTFPKSNIVIMTNGLLLQQMPVEFWKTCAANKIHINVTNYPIRVDFDTIKEMGEAYKVPIKVPQRVNEFFQFVNINGDSDPEVSFKNCRAMYTTLFLRGMKLYTCSFAPHVHIFNTYFHQDIPLSEGDFIDLQGKVTPDEIYGFVNNSTPLCRWCKERRTPMKWRRSKKSNAEWISEDKAGFFHNIEISKYKLISAYHHARQVSAMRKRHKNDA